MALLLLAFDVPKKRRHPKGLLLPNQQNKKENLKRKNWKKNQSNVSEDKETTFAMEYKTKGEAGGEQKFTYYPLKLIIDNLKSLKA
jgi:hypothetical protein